MNRVCIDLDIPLDLDPGISFRFVGLQFDKSSLVHTSEIFFSFNHACLSYTLTSPDWRFINLPGLIILALGLGTQKGRIAGKKRKERLRFTHCRCDEVKF